MRQRKGGTGHISSGGAGGDSMVSGRSPELSIGRKRLKELLYEED
jgi:hypothetical protein